MGQYKVVWQSYLYGESKVEANSLEEARLKALANEDDDFEQLDPENDWEIESVEEIPE